MSGEVLLSGVLVTLALVFYTVGVWSERLQRYLRPWHLGAFWVGLVLDGAGTYAMDRLVPGWQWNVHAFTGLSAFLLMLVHAAWASWVVWCGSAEAKGTFHRYSLFVWLFWLIPYFGGMYAGMASRSGG